jgi:hypothetical protein
MWINKFSNVTSVSQHEVDLSPTDWIEIPENLSLNVNQIFSVINDEVVIQDLPNLDDYLTKLKQTRNILLSLSDKYLLPDYRISQEDRESLIIARNSLRDFPLSYVQGSKLSELVDLSIMKKLNIYEPSLMDFV